MAFADWARVEQTTDAGRAEIGAGRIYILPTRYGLIFAVLLFLMLLGAVNYGNNPAHLLTFVLAGLASNAIYQTWRNLRGLQLTCRGAVPVFAGEPVPYVVEVQPDGRARPAIQLQFYDAAPVLVDLADDGPVRQLTLSLQELPRGSHRPGRLTVSSRFPVGLFRAWCYIDCARPVLVYPAPGAPWDPPGEDGLDIDSGGEGNGSDDFAGLRVYRRGDRPSQIDWKAYARDRGLNTRLFSGRSAGPLWLNWEDTPGDDVESRLSALTRAILDAEAAGREYGLRMPTGEVDPGIGPAQRHRSLRLLALYGWDDG